MITTEEAQAFTAKKIQDAILNIQVKTDLIVERMRKPMTDADLWQAQAKLVACSEILTNVFERITNKDNK